MKIALASLAPGPDGSIRVELPPDSNRDYALVRGHIVCFMDGVSGAKDVGAKYDGAGIDPSDGKAYAFFLPPASAPMPGPYVAVVYTVSG